MLLMLMVMMMPPMGVVSLWGTGRDDISMQFASALYSIVSLSYSGINSFLFSLLDFKLFIHRFLDLTEFLKEFKEKFCLFFSKEKG